MRFNVPSNFWHINSDHVLPGTSPRHEFVDFVDVDVPKIDVESAPIAVSWRNCAPTDGRVSVCLVPLIGIVPNGASMHTIWHDNDHFWPVSYPLPASVLDPRKIVLSSMVGRQRSSEPGGPSAQQFVYESFVIARGNLYRRLSEPVYTIRQTAVSGAGTRVELAIVPAMNAFISDSLGTFPINQFKQASERAMAILEQRPKHTMASTPVACHVEVPYLARSVSLLKLQTSRSQPEDRVLNL